MIRRNLLLALFIALVGFGAEETIVTGQMIDPCWAVWIEYDNCHDFDGQKMMSNGWCDDGDPIEACMDRVRTELAYDDGPWQYDPEEYAECCKAYAVCTSTPSPWPDVLGCSYDPSSSGGGN